MTDHRTAIVNYLTKQLLGPLGGPEETLEQDPLTQYLTGVLFPITESMNRFTDDDIIEEGGGQIGPENGDDPVALSNQRMPSSAGISFLVDTGPLQVRVDAGTYRREEGSWIRSAHSDEIVANPGDDNIPVLEGRARIRIVWRPWESGYLVTLSIVNSMGATEFAAPAQAALFQVELTCSPVDGDIRGYPTSGTFFNDEEEEEHALLYRSRPAFAIGHGASADWQADGLHASQVALSFMPSETVPPADFQLGGFERVLDLHNLIGIADAPDDVLVGLQQFVDAYAEWSEHLRSMGVPSSLEGAKQRLLERQRTAHRRMTEGVDLLRGSAELRTAFGLANRAMLMQMCHSDPDLHLGAVRKQAGSFQYRDPDYSAQQRAWRPFQLAFLLMNLASIAEEDARDRGVVDLIWFPTGGGKTEAYLGLVALTVILRRWRHGDEGAGTAVITRYTLRLLTSQQFQRAATLVCALEIIRREDTRGDDVLGFGAAPITAGLWVGGSTSPIHFPDAKELLDKILTGREEGQVGFQVELCPWCGTEIVPKTNRTDSNVGVRATNYSFEMFCPSPSCPFRDFLPLSSVDDSLYETPPTVLVATVDKFAQVVWQQRAGAFLGQGRERGPDLIIQDELHLISGPLGTMVGLYEAAFEAVLEASGTKPKIVASTATIRNASQHVSGLFDRPVFVFPPSGLDSDDSYFVRLDRDRPGRQYVGVMSQVHSPTTATVRTSASLLQAPVEVPLDPTSKDQVWTLVAYHNSLRELGRTVTLARDDIPSWIEITASSSENRRRLDEDDDVVELTSNVPAASIPLELEKLGRSYDSGDAVSFVCATNMLSVGVDVSRLGLMVVLGQPKTTSEYIQATSRVGRSHPGLVVTLLSSAKPRDRSHYEAFRAYHQSMYRQVEPTSVTPFSLPARRRALHAALVVVMRHAKGLLDNGEAQNFDPIAISSLDAMKWLASRAERVDPVEAENTRLHLEQLFQEWEIRTINPDRNLRYRGGKGRPSLLKRFTEEGQGWVTLDSMRDVDFEAFLKVRGE